MRPSLPLLLAAAALVAAPSPAQAAAPCAGLKPAKLIAKPNKAGTAVTLTWRGKSQARVAWRVTRDGDTVGQTRAPKMRVRVTPGKRHALTVTAFVGGRRTACRARLKLKPAGGKVRRGAPGRVTGVSATVVAAGQLKVTWQKAEAGASPIAGYRVVRDGRTTGQIRATESTVKIIPGRTYKVQVAAAARDGRVGPLSDAVTVASGHVGPTAPLAPAISDVGNTAATLSWGASTASDGANVSYRVLRDGKVSQSARDTRVRLTKLASARTIGLAVQAVDSYGWTSPVSDGVSFVTGHEPPGAPGAPAVQAVTDTQLHLAWQAGALPDGTALRGYRLMRDGRVTGQAAAAEARVGNLAPLARHTWTVAAVDTLGYVSQVSAPLATQQAAPPAASGSAQAFLLASTDASFVAFQKHYRQLDVVYPTYYDCAIGSGALGGRNDPLVTRFAQDRGVKVLPRFNCQDTNTMHRILNEPALRSTWLDRIVAEVRDNGYDGANIDFEAVLAADRNALTSFVAELAARLHADGKLISQAVSAKVKDVANHPRSTAFDYAALSRHLDWVFVMAWGIKWQTSTPGAQDDIRWVRQVADYVASMPLKHKFVMGTMLYAMDWPNGGGPANPAAAWHYDEVVALAQRTGSTPVLDTVQNSWHLAYTENGVRHDVYYSDAALVEARMELARARGLGVGFWRIGQEDERLWSSPLLG